MKVNQDGINLIKKFEGCRLTAYKCPAGVWTIGYGHASGVKEGMTITQEQAEEYLKQDLEKFEKGVDDCVKVGINQNQFNALVSFAYNCGIGALQTSTLLKKLNKCDFEGTANEFLRWNKSNGAVLPGLTNRRVAEREMFLKPAAKGSSDELPYSVRITANLNIRKEPNGQIIGSYMKGTTAKVWAIQTVGTEKWGKNEKGFFSLKYTERI